MACGVELSPRATLRGSQALVSRIKNVFLATQIRPWPCGQPSVDAGSPRRATAHRQGQLAPAGCLADVPEPDPRVVDATVLIQKQALTAKKQHMCLRYRYQGMPRCSATKTAGWEEMALAESR